MHREFYSVTPEAAAAINRAKAEGRRIIAVGTTAVRTLESAGVTGEVKAGGNWTQIYIYPGYQWHIVDALVRAGHQLPSAPEHAADAGIVPVVAGSDAAHIRRSRQTGIPILLLWGRHVYYRTG